MSTETSAAAANDGDVDDDDDDDGGGGGGGGCYFAAHIPPDVDCVAVTAVVATSFSRQCPTLI